MKAIIKGGKIPKGKVKVSGAKNSATRLLAAATLSDEEVKLENFPINLVDARHKIRFLENIGAEIEVDEKKEQIKINSRNIRCQELDLYNYPIRTTYLLVAGQIKRSGIAKIPYPGGCKIGSRGYDLHIKVWEWLGCTVTEEDNYIKVVGDGFKGGVVKFPISTVGGTENALICASIASGTTEIINAYITPEIEDLIDFLRRMGADISVNGSSHVTVKGKQQLKGAIKTVMFDRIEALTWLVYGVLSRGEILIENVPFESMEVPLLHLKKAGIDFLSSSNSIYISPECLKNGQVEPFELACGAHPGIISDMQSFYTLLGVIARGDSRIFDYRYPKRIAYAEELQKLINESVVESEEGKITLRGPGTFKASEVTSTDLRGSMALVIAALCAEGTSVVNEVEMALRGYNNLSKKLEQLGIDVFILED
ncbi:UDP-N-acetylglucosamine 1-carboxyvinyltransferase [Vibrio lentus]|uniref:UDP-N-acetylglucosamine 1-carboxyvinyltransferase n=1 Tax=Vibrio lentus TaxID=136468 RepID=A0A2N7IJK6_9VIBR|nr:UDP-N-acetylglucosamine 1-carboxyvinyltransferase [Vibrio lentus]PML57940.1 UDP-N-acetylglucosamine 1-carboxyvinyltransferase [Vibrio lentus]PMM25318.1 UDP-N-acetylglucosamine 1-carboxyvinyltransferase [Vibrio lentus]